MTKKIDNNFDTKYRLQRNFYLDHFVTFLINKASTSAAGSSPDSTSSSLAKSTSHPVAFKSSRVTPGANFAVPPLLRLDFDLPLPLEVLASNFPQSSYKLLRPARTLLFASSWSGSFKNLGRLIIQAFLLLTNGFMLRVEKRTCCIKQKFNGNFHQHIETQEDSLGFVRASIFTRHLSLDEVIVLKKISHHLGLHNPRAAALAGGLGPIDLHDPISQLLKAIRGVEV
jgi:hypothetical protein